MSWGFGLPEWQRGLVWTKRQKISFIESAWRGVPLGTYSFNRAPLGSPLDDLLIDGQQRMNAIECYLRDEFAVFGWRWSEVTEVDQRVWEMAILFEVLRHSDRRRGLSAQLLRSAEFRRHAPP
ncbi:DUF262 domain-containing protein (plasmid) [Agrobacterium leguminum]|uniref:DUF262 domain-containing protein n=1 Tax=Agrobacterium leguminum TaxID=2792015 RepID=UPI0030CFD62F